MRWFFARLDEKGKVLRNFAKIRKFWMKNLLKNWIFILFYFLFYFIFRKFVTKNRAFGNNNSFLQQIFRFRVWEFLLFPPVYAIACGFVSEFHSAKCFWITYCQQFWLISIKHCMNFGYLVDRWQALNVPICLQLPERFG